MHPRPTLSSQIRYNVDILRQADALIAELAARRLHQAYAAQIGPHLRHVMDHYEAFLEGLPRGIVDYESRPRDARVQSDPAYARAKLAQLLARLQALPETLPPGSGERGEPLAVVAAVGLDGAELSASQSSVQRELQFLGLHVVHHYAVLAPRLRALGLSLHEDFGKGPGTIRHERGKHR